MKRFGWMIATLSAALLLAGCGTKTEPYHGSGNPGGNPGGATPERPSEGTVTVRENKTWTVSYAGRKNVSGAPVEVIEVNNVPSSQQFLVSVINKANYETYKGDVLAFMQQELEVTPEEYIYRGAPQVIHFSPFRHGTWYAFIIGLDNSHALTGEYAYLRFLVEEEEPTAEFKSWLGDWTVDGGAFSYDITVSSLEANFVYKVEGWETTGESSKNHLPMEMNMEYLETFFEQSDGKMYFTSQYIQTYADEDRNNQEVDEFFLGQIDYDGITEEMGLYVITDEGLDLASASMQDAESGRAILEPCQVEVPIGKDTFRGPFYNMQYFYTPDAREWNKYNEDTAILPMTMVRRDASTTPRMRPALRSGVQEREKALRGKVYKPRSERGVAKTVRKAL